MGLVAVLIPLHDELDAVVLDAYGWHDAPGDEQILERLATLGRARLLEDGRWMG